MPRVKLGANAEVDILSKDEVDKSLAHYFAMSQAARGRGVKPIIREFNTGTIGTSTAYAIQGPEQGYSWAIRLVGAILSASETLQVYQTGDNNTVVPANGLIGSAAAGTNTVITWSNIQGIVRGGDYIAFSAGGNCSVAVRLVAEEVPTELEWKLV